jgi:ATP/maltotriose-dependent transcriptional regulator MalT
VSVFFQLPLIIPHDVAQYAKKIFDRAPAEIFQRVKYFASTHLNVIACLGNLLEFYALAKRYEQKFLALPMDDEVRNATLCGIYFSLAVVRSAFAFDETYDFDIYFTKMFDCLTQEAFDLISIKECHRAPWINLTYSSEKGAPQQYVEAMIRAETTAARFSNGVTLGADDLIQGELLFYQGKVKEAEPFVLRAIENAAKRMAFNTMHRALLYLMRIYVAKGDTQKAETALTNLKNLLDEKEFLQRFCSYDIAFGWFQHILRQPEAFPRWLTEAFSPYAHASAAENFGNQIKARYHYLTRNFLPLLDYISEMKRRESFLFGRIEMLAMEACVHYKMKEKKLAWSALKEAYNEASPNEILMPFIELGKDTRTLAMAALRESSLEIPRAWLETVRYKAGTYAHNQSKLAAEHMVGDSIRKILSVREQEVLSDVYHGLSRGEIAEKRNLSASTVKSVIGSIYKKLNVHKIADLIRVAGELGLV